MKMESHGLTLTVDPATGRWTSLVGGKAGSNWLSNEADSLCGLPFVAATALGRGSHIPVTYKDETAGRRCARSERGEVLVAIEATRYGLAAKVTLPDLRGPRSGWCLDLNHLDLPGDSIRDQVMPVCMQTAEDLAWSMVIWQRGEGDCLLTAFDGPLAGWYIRYSYAGHRMLGFDVYARADDVVAPVARFAGGRLPDTTQLRVHLAPVGSVDAGIGLACSILGLARVKPSQTSVAAGGTVGLQVAGQAGAPVSPEAAAHALEWRRPDGSAECLTSGTREVSLVQPGVHTFTSTAASGRRYTAGVMAVGDWKAMADKAITFHREHYQLACGAFARCINGRSLTPDGFTFEGVPFGDADVHQSCRTGEFGGFAAWAQLIHMKRFGRNEPMLTSVRRYFDWMTNKGREDNPRPNTLCHQPHSYGGRQYGPFHFHEESNYVQHEAWLLEHFSDALDLGMEEYRDVFVKFANHFLREHVDENGVVWNQNHAAESARHDYCTVDAPLLHMLRAARKLIALRDPLGPQMLQRVRKGVEYVYRRGFNFATEGESCTEDGSMSCIAWTLAAAYNELGDPDPDWLDLADRIMTFHAKLEMRGDDIRTDGSTIRFWETQYESDDYGPSINAAHGWTLWSALARWELFRATGDFEHLWQAWRHSACVAHRMNNRGWFPSCFTPDIIPAPPHADRWGAQGAVLAEGRMTTARTGLGYPSTLSMSGMHLFVAAPRMWYTTCGYDAATGRLVNARLDDGILVPNTPVPCETVGLSGPRNDLGIANLAPGADVRTGRGKH